MRILHTADWHLGQKLHSQSRDAEHRAFMDWLLGCLVDQQIDALLIAGDVFDTANPGAEAQALYYGFLAHAAQQVPGLDVVVIAGNHDAASRLDAPAAILQALNVRVVGGMGPDGPAVFPLHDAQGQVRAQVAAVPFLRTAQLPPSQADDPLVDGVRQVYAQACKVLDTRAQPGQARIAMGHAYMVGGQLSQLSERRVLGGNQHALPVDIFPDSLDYVALGHLHRAQAVGRDTVRYAGSPIPLALDEASYTHQVVLIDLDEQGAVSQIQPLPVPRHVEIIRVPARDTAPLEQVTQALAALPVTPAPQPYVHAYVSLSGPQPDLPELLHDALPQGAGRLLHAAGIRQGPGGALAEVQSQPELNQLRPTQVFELLHHKLYDEPPAPALLSLFHELLDTLDQEGAR